MTVGELEARMSARELYEWNEFFRLRTEAEKKAHEAAKSKASASRGRGRRR